MTTKSASYPGLEESDIMRAMVELVESAGDAGLPDDELYAALEQLESLLVSAATWSLWSDGTTRVGWDAAAGDLTWRLAEGGPVVSDGGRR